MIWPRWDCNCWGHRSEASCQDSFHLAESNLEFLKANSDLQHMQLPVNQLTAAGFKAYKGILQGQVA